ncbi:MAG: nucleotide exchange factor GrpE [Acidobacteriota bacterium]|nr:MAG: nucleotide exchange factor GrpE [Acidobacteriota bacterium]
MFKRKKMSELDHLIEEHPEDMEPPIAVKDKRRFNENGELVRDDEPEAGKKTVPVKPQRETELEAQLKAEVERREAAEAKLVGVQAKFEEAKAELEKETAEMRERLKRTLEDRANQNKFNFLQTLLPVLDNLHLAVNASEEDPSIENLRTGVKGVARSFEHALASVGVETVPSIGTNFDPELHEAVDMAPADAENDGKIVAEYQTGYRFGDRLLRPARVQVGKAG